MKLMKTAYKKNDVYGLGNAIVDILSFVPDDFLNKVDLKHNTFILSDSNKQSEILKYLEEHNIELRAGGSVANSIWNLMLCGAKVCYSGKYSNDVHGLFFSNEFLENGIILGAPISKTNLGPTGTCIVLTTPDTQRTMSTHLGVSSKFSVDDINFDLIKNSHYLLCEGYLFTENEARKALFEATEFAKNNNVKVAFSLSDTFVVEAFKNECLTFIKNFCDLIFCNINELKALYKTNSDNIEITNESCLNNLSEIVTRAFVTNSDEGCYTIENKEIKHVSGYKVKAIDATGAGDAFAGGALYYLTNEEDDMNGAAIFANKMGSKVVQIHGARLHHEQIKDILKFEEKNVRAK